MLKNSTIFFIDVEHCIKICLYKSIIGVKVGVLDTMTSKNKHFIVFILDTCRKTFSPTYC